MYSRCAHFGASRSPRGKTEDFFFGDARRCLTSLTGAELVSSATSPAAAATDGAAWLAIWVRPLLCVATRTPCSSPPPTKLPYDIVWCLACSLSVLDLGGACSGVSTVACLGKTPGSKTSTPPIHIHRRCGVVWPRAAALVLGASSASRFLGLRYFYGHKACFLQSNRAYIFYGGESETKTITVISRKIWPAYR